MERNAARGEAWVVLALTISVVCAGVAYPVTAAALRHSSPSVVTTVRALGGGLLMVPVLGLVGARLPRGRRAWAWAAAISVGNVVLTLAGIAEGTRLAGAAISSVLVNSAPFFAALFARVWLGERLEGRQAAGLVVGFAGIVLIVGAQGGTSGRHVVAGTLVCLAGALGWTAAGLGMRFLATSDPGFDVCGATAAQLLCGGVLLIPYLLLDRPAPTQWSSPALWGSLTFLVAGAQVAGFVGFYLALSRWSSARVFSWSFLVPAVAVCVGAMQGDLPGAAATAGLVIVVAGVGLVTAAGVRPSGARAEAP
jgi:drug/metabolite transporter (DMT)-like permease